MKHNFLALALGFLMTEAMALPQPLSLESRQNRLFASASYFDTKANYSLDGGSYSSLGGGRYYRLISEEFGGEVELLPTLSVLATLSLARAESYDGSFTRTNTGLTEGLAGVRYLFVGQWIKLVPELLFVFPFNPVDEATDDVLTGEGAMSVDAGAWAFVPLRSVTPYSRLSFRYRDGERASHILWRLGSDWQLGIWRPYFEGSGSIVVISDGKKNFSYERESVTNRVNGSSYKFYSIDPRELSLRGGLDVALAKEWTLTSYFEQTINGQSAASGFTVMLGLEWNFSQAGADDKFNDQGSRDDSEEPQFKPDSPEYDPELFDPPRPKAKTQGASPPKRVRRTRPKPVDIDKSLNEVQRSLEN